MTERLHEFSEEQKKIELYPRFLDIGELEFYGVDEYTANTLEKSTTDGGFELSMDTLIIFQENGVNVRQIIGDLFAPEHRLSFLQETRDSLSDYLSSLKKPNQSFSETTKPAQDVLVSTWKNHSKSNAQNYSEYLAATKEAREKYQEIATTFRYDMYASVARSAMEIIDGAPIAAIGDLESFGFSTLERDYVWQSLGKTFAVTEFNMRKAIREGLKPFRVANMPLVHETENVLKLRTMVDKESNFLEKPIVTATKNVFIDASGGLNI